MPSEAWNAIAAIATSVAAVVAVITLLIAIQALRDAQEAQRDLQRPTLITTNDDMNLVRNDDGTINFRFVDEEGFIERRPPRPYIGLDNTGAGPATNIYGVIFGP